MKVNGKQVEFVSNMNITDLLGVYELDEKKVVVEVNGVILETNQFYDYVINDEDSIEIVSFVGGG